MDQTDPMAQETMQSVEPYGASLLRQFHEDCICLLMEYDGAMAPLDNPAVRQFMMENVKLMERQFITGAEKLFKKTYKELPPLDGGEDQGAVPEDGPPPEGDISDADSVDVEMGPEETPPEFDAPMDESPPEDAPEKPKKGEKSLRGAKGHNAYSGSTKRSRRQLADTDYGEIGAEYVDGPNGPRSRRIGYQQGGNYTVEDTNLAAIFSAGDHGDSSMVDLSYGPIVESENPELGEEKSVRGTKAQSSPAEDPQEEREPDIQTPQQQAPSEARRRLHINILERLRQHAQETGRAPSGRFENGKVNQRKYVDGMGNEMAGGMNSEDPATSELREDPPTGEEAAIATFGEDMADVKSGRARHYITERVNHDRRGKVTGRPETRAIVYTELGMPVYQDDPAVVIGDDDYQVRMATGYLARQSAAARDVDKKPVFDDVTLNGENLKGDRKLPDEPDEPDRKGKSILFSISPLQGGKGFRVVERTGQKSRYADLTVKGVNKYLGKFQSNKSLLGGIAKALNAGRGVKFSLKAVDPEALNAARQHFQQGQHRGRTNVHTARSMRQAGRSQQDINDTLNALSESLSEEALQQASQLQMPGPERFSQNGKALCKNCKSAQCKCGKSMTKSAQDVLPPGEEVDAAALHGQKVAKQKDLDLKKWAAEEEAEHGEQPAGNVDGQGRVTLIGPKEQEALELSESLLTEMSDFGKTSLTDEDRMKSYHAYKLMEPLGALSNSEKSLSEGEQQFAKDCGRCAEFLKMLSREKAFGQPHRDEADYHAKKVRKMLDEVGRKAQPESVDGMVGEMGEKELKALLDAATTQAKQLESLTAAVTGNRNS